MPISSFRRKHWNSLEKIKKKNLPDKVLLPSFILCHSMVQFRLFIARLMSYKEIQFIVISKEHCRGASAFMPCYWGKMRSSREGTTDGTQETGVLDIGVLYFHCMERQVTSRHLCLGFTI